MQNYSIFDIVRGSMVDGPGVRTTVFFSGCNLRCAWCHNPESQSGKMEIFTYADKCAHCGKCRTVCPTGAMVDCCRVDRTRCSFCGKCVAECPQEALRICGREYGEDELFNILCRDKAFYDGSGGGVTFSGGECMLYPDLLFAMLSRCRTAGISCVVDTAGNVPFEQLERVLPVTDLFLYDLKVMDDGLHRRFTGVGNRRILENLRRLFDAGARVWVRVPVIPGVNDTEENTRMLASFLAPYSPEKVEFMPYHRLGEGKYTALDRLPAVFSVPDSDKMNTLRKLYKDFLDEEKTKLTPR